MREGVCRRPLRRGDLRLSALPHREGVAGGARDVPRRRAASLVPVTWLGPERGKHAPPLAQEQVETHVLMMLALTAQCHDIRRELCNGLRDDDVHKLQTLFDELGTHLQDTFAELSRQHRLLEELRANVTAMRVRCIHMTTAVWQANRDVPWLGRAMTVPWMEVFQAARSKAATHKDAEIWNQCSRSKSLVERTIGKDAMMLAIRGKRARDGDGDE